jgi:hypothetical protein
VFAGGDGRLDDVRLVGVGHQLVRYRFGQRRSLAFCAANSSSVSSP